MHFNNSKLPPLSSQEGWISDGCHVLAAIGIAKERKDLKVQLDSSTMW
jgi:hypothetical protein